MTTIAENFITHFADGQTFETAEDILFSDLAKQWGADVTYSAREYDEDGAIHYVDGYHDGYISGDPIRHEFSDGSAVVEAGDGWDLEGPERYSWAGS